VQPPVRVDVDLRAGDESVRQRSPGTVDRAAYVFCVLEQFHRHLLRRDIYASPSARWADPRAKLLTGAAWDAARGTALNALGLPEDPGELLAEHAAELDGAWRALSDGLVAGSEVHVDADGRLHADKIAAIADPPSLIDVRRRLEGMLPRVDLPDLILEVMAWHPAFVAAFAGVSGGRSRLADLHVTIAAALTAHALNVGYVPVISEGVPALTRGRISHVDQNYLRPENYTAANSVLIGHRTRSSSPAGGAAAWSPASTGCASSSRSAASTRARTPSTSGAGAARPG